MTPLFAGKVVYVDEGHEYYVDVDGTTKKIPSLSVLLKKQGLTPEYDREIPKHILETAAKRGSEVHTALANEIIGYGAEVSEEIREWFENGKKLYRKHKMDATHIEVPFFNPVFDYCCTPDFVGIVEGKLSIVDWKSTKTIHPQAGFQLAGQALCFRYPEKFNLYIGDLRRGVLVPFDSSIFLTPTRTAFQLYNDVQDIVEAF